MYFLEQVGPTEMVQACRRADPLAKRIYVCANFFGIEMSLIAERCPDVAKLLPRFGVGQDPVHHAVPSAGTSDLIGPFLAFVPGKYVIVVVQRQVVVPNGAGIDKGIHTFLPHINLPKHVGVSAEFIGQKILQERFQIQMGAVSQ